VSIFPGSEAEAINEVADMLVRDGIHPSVVFAFRQCGVLITPNSRDRVPPEIVANWDQALARWHQMHPA
jgi:hypothetical protein